MGVLEYRVNWGSGGPNPGVTVVHGRISGAFTSAQAAQALADRTRTFFDAMKGYVGGGVAWTFPAEVTEHNTATGDLEGVDAITAPAPVTSTGSGAYAAPSGMRFEWRTDAIVSGRRLRGRTFIVPLVTSQYETNGTISGTLITAAQTAANAFLSAGVFTACQPSVWSRTHGVQSDITSANIPDEVAILRSRRD